MTVSHWLLAFVVFGAGAQAAPSEDELLAMASRGLGQAAQRWNVAARLVPTGTDSMISRPGGDVAVGKPALRQVAARVPQPQLEPVIAWLMAHEAWHQVQFRNGLVPGAPRPVQLQSECEADVMGAYASVDAQLAVLGSAATSGQGDAIAANLVRVVNTVGQLEEGFNGILSHPPANIRGLAIRTGASRALYERLYQLASDPEIGLVRDRVAALHDIRVGEGVPAWATRLCKLMLHQGDGVGSLALDNPSIRWNKSADAPVVGYSFPYRNNGSAPIHVTLQVRSASVPRTAGGDVSRWTFADAERTEFDLQPGATFAVSGTLRWYATEELKPRLLYPPHDPSFYDVALVQAQAGASQPVQVGLDPELEKLRAALQTLYTSSVLKFRDIAPSCPIEDGEESCLLKLAVPGMISGEVTRYADGSSDARLTFYEGSSGPDALAAYQKFHDRVRAIYPALNFTYSQDGETRRFALKPAAHATLYVTRRKRLSGEYVVYALIEPKFL